MLKKLRLNSSMKAYKTFSNTKQNKTKQNSGVVRVCNFESYYPMTFIMSYYINI